MDDESGTLTTEVPQLALSEIVLGRQVGTGGFCNVTEIEFIRLDEVHDISPRDAAIRRDFASTSTAQNNQYALKTIRKDLGEEDYNKGIQDLAIEAEFLATLSHQNIIALRGQAQTNPLQPGFFLILDLLQHTLTLKFNYWRKLVGQNSGTWVPCCGYWCSNAHLLHQVWRDRLFAALDIARAVQYLHTQDIIYRDLKPDNIGFGRDNVLKIFDLGLCKRVDQLPVVQDGTYRLTGNTGSLRYMAPEVALNRPYNKTADAFSYGILFWQICSLTTPFLKFTERMHAERVVQQAYRPKPDITWPQSWVNLMQSCWNTDLHSRPSFDNIVETLSESIETMAQDEHIVPSRTSEIRAKKRKSKKKADVALDIDTRLSPHDYGDHHDSRIDNDMV